MKKITLLSIVLTFALNGFALNTPTQSSPADGATGIHTDATLWINQVSGASYYDYMLDTAATFDSPALRTKTHSGSFSGWTPGDLFFNKTYYWKIRARTDTDTSLWSSVWSFTTNIYGVTQSSPAGGSLNQNVKFTLWINDLGAEVFDYQVDTLPSFDSPALREFSHTDTYSGWTISDLRYNQKYYWRVRGRNDADTSAWTDAWNFTTKNYGVTLQSPVNNATDINPKTTLWINKVEGSENFDYQADTVPSFNSGALREFSHTDTYSGWTIPDLMYNQKYYWRVRGRNDADTSVWTEVWNFTTKLYGATQSSPADGSENIPLSTTLWINTVPGSENYDYQVDTSLTFNSPLLSEYTHSDTYSGMNINLTRYGQRYYWRVRGRNDADTSIWSSVWNFKTDYELSDAPVLIAPANGSTDISYASVLLDWNSISGANLYVYEVSTNSDFSNIVKSGTTSLTDYTVTDLNPYTLYYWRVKGENNNGYSPWSEVWSFTTESVVLTSPVLLSPANNAVNINYASVDFSWEAVFGANNYNFEISQDNSFSTGVSDFTTSETSYNLTGLNSNTEYYWRVSATDGITTSDWSDVWHFTTLEPSPVETKEKFDLSIYPNPANNFVMIKGINNTCSLKISDITGKIISEIKFYNGEVVDLSQINSGYYILKIIDGNKKYIKSFIIKH